MNSETNDDDLQMCEISGRFLQYYYVLHTQYYFLFVFALAGILEYIGMMIPVGGTARHKIAPEPKLRTVEFATVDFDRSEELVKSVLVAAQPGSQPAGETNGYMGGS